MNKKLFAITSALLLTSVTPALAETRVEFRSAAFFPMEHRFRSIYGTVGADYELQVTQSNPCNCFEVWANFTWYPKSGSRCGNTNITVINGSFGIDYMWQFCNCFNFYAGIGPIFGAVFVENKFSNCSSNNGCNRKDDSEWAGAVGGIIKTGIIYYVTCCLFLDLFVDYFYEPAFFKHRTADVGGFRTGLGIGLAF
ncbi:MAG: hypothetical protein JSS30_03660 [Verrucomicrobia bacterium]|nr:hypothetical protein [Verrucomicrobiota bacterium]